MQIDIDRLVGDAHRAATQLDRCPVLSPDQLIVLKSFDRRCRLYRLLGRRRAAFRRARESRAKHADRAEFHRSRELVPAAGAGALRLCAHVPNRPSAAISEDSDTTLRWLL